MVLGKPTTVIGIGVGQGPTALAMGAGAGCLDIFSLAYDGPNGSLFISILLHNSEFRNLHYEFRNLEL